MYVNVKVMVPYVTTGAPVELVVAGVAHAHLALDAEARDDGLLGRTLVAEDLSAVAAVMLQTRTQVKESSPYRAGLRRVVRCEERTLRLKVENCVRQR